MSNRKGRGIIITAVASVLSIGIFSALFIGANSIGLAEATGKTGTIAPRQAVVAPTAAAANADADLTADVSDIGIIEDSQIPAMTIYESSRDGIANHPRSASALTMEEAAEIGAYYIWDMFGDSIYGKHVEMFYTAFPSSTRTYWHGSVSDSSGELAYLNAIYTFTIDAISGERVSATQIVRREDERTMRSSEEALASIELYNARSDEFIPLVEEFASKHFGNTKLESIELAFAGGRVVGEAIITFNVTDETGREARMTFDFYTRWLSSVCSQMSDIVPGWNPEVYEGGLG